MSPPSSRSRARATAAAAVRHDISLLTNDDLYLFNEGSHFRLHEKLGAHLMTIDGTEGTYFAVWAPDAKSVAVIGDFNAWDRESHPLRPKGQAGIWEGFVPGVGKGALYKFHIASRYKRYSVDKADPLAVHSETPPKTASVVWDCNYDWRDEDWMANRAERSAPDAPIAIYEVHLGSWMHVPEGNRSLSYREVAPKLADHADRVGFTHVELMPVMEHPHYESWGYQITAFFAPTSRYGTPQDLMYLIDGLHQRGIAVILDWVPFHFPTDPDGLRFFDGTHLYEREGVHPRWKTHVFNYGRPEVDAFMLSNALFWLDKYHADGLRVDAVSSMVFPDYPPEQGVEPRAQGPMNRQAMEFLRRFNHEVSSSYPGVLTFAEDSKSIPLVTRQAKDGGLGFNMKWALGWQHDTLDAYMTQDPSRRRNQHGKLTLPMLDLFKENFVLSLSHDEVQPGKGSLLNKMPGDESEKFANVRLFLAYMYAYPGKKLIFMGSEFAQRNEWNVNLPLEWHLSEKPAHAGVECLLSDLNRLYRGEPALHELDFGESGFVGINCDDDENSTISFIRRGKSSGDIVIVCNFSARAHHGYRIGIPRGGVWRELLNTDAREYGGSGQGNLGSVEADSLPAHHHTYSLTLTLPPLSTIYLKRQESHK